MNRLLACIDASLYLPSVCDHAAWAAERMQSSVELLHVLQRVDAITARHDLSGTVGLGAKTRLLEELAELEASQSRLAQEQGRALLEAGAERLKAGGARDVDCTHRHGGIVETVIEREADCDLVVIGKRGASADFAKGHLGSKVERVVRQSVKPVLVASRAFRPVRRAVIAFDGGASARKALAFAGTSPLFEAVQFDVILAGQENERNRDHLRWAGEVLGERARRIECVPGDAESTLVSVAEQGEADMMLMGAYGHSPLRSLIVGSTTTAMIRAVPLPVLLFR